jgi:23S rRNA pseudouridine2605 synthase
MEERLQKILSRAGVASRRAAERLIEEARVTLNGETVRELGTRADAEKDDIRVDGSRVRLAEKLVYLVLNKPKGVISTRSDPAGRPTVMGLVPRVAGLFPVGRLDVTTEGLLLLTTDGAFAEKVAHPRYEVPRVYLAKVSRIPDERTLEKLRSGVYSEGDRLVADRVKVVEADNNAWLEVTVHEGRNREVKRLLEAVGHPVSKLRRVAIGPITDKGLALGQFRELTLHEVRVLLGSGPKEADRKTSRVRHPGGKGRPVRRHGSPSAAAGETKRGLGERGSESARRADSSSGRSRGSGPRSGAGRDGRAFGSGTTKRGSGVSAGRRGLEGGFGNSDSREGGEDRGSQGRAGSAGRGQSSVKGRGRNVGTGGSIRRSEDGWSGRGEGGAVGGASGPRRDSASRRGGAGDDARADRSVKASIVAGRSGKGVGGRRPGPRKHSR